MGRNFFQSLMLNTLVGTGREYPDFYEDDLIAAMYEVRTFEEVSRFVDGYVDYLLEYQNLGADLWRQHYTDAAVDFFLHRYVANMAPSFAALWRVGIERTLH